MRSAVLRLEIGILILPSIVGCGERQIQSELRRDTSSYSFGRVWSHDRITASFEIENPSSDVLKVSSFRSSCRCISISPQSAAIPSQQIRRFEVELDGRSYLNALESPVSVSIVGIAEGGRLLPPIFVRGVILNSVIASVPHVHLGEFVVGETIQSGSFEIRRNLSCSVPEVSTDETVLKSDINWDADQEEGILIVEPVSPLPPGHFSHKVTLKCSCEGSADIVSTDLMVTWRVLGRTTVMPRTLVMGQLKESGICDRLVTFHSVDQTAMSVVPENGIPDGVTVTPGVESNTYVVSVTSALLQPDKRKLEIPFTAKYPDLNTEERIVIPVIYWFDVD